MTDGPAMLGRQDLEEDVHHGCPHLVLRGVRHVTGLEEKVAWPVGRAERARSREVGVVSQWYRDDIGSVWIAETRRWP